MIVRELNHMAWIRTSIPAGPAKRAAGRCKAARDGGGKSPWSLLLKDDASKRGRVMPVTASARDGGQ